MFKDRKLQKLLCTFLSILILNGCSLSNSIPNFFETSNNESDEIISLSVKAMTEIFTWKNEQDSNGIEYMLPFKKEILPAWTYQNIVNWKSNPLKNDAGELCRVTNIEVIDIEKTILHLGHYDSIYNNGSTATAGKYTITIEPGYTPYYLNVNFYGINLEAPTEENAQYFSYDNGQKLVAGDAFITNINEKELGYYDAYKVNVNVTTNMKDDADNYTLIWVKIYNAWYLFSI